MGLYDDKTGFNYEKFVEERMGIGRGKMQWMNWKDVAWYYGIGTQVNCNEQELRKGNMTKTLYESLCRTFGREQMEEYFPKQEAGTRRQPTLHLSPTSIMANGVGKQPPCPADRPTHLQGKGEKTMTDREIEELADLMLYGRKR